MSFLTLFLKFQYSLIFIRKPKLGLIFLQFRPIFPSSDGCCRKLLPQVPLWYQLFIEPAWKIMISCPIFTWRYFFFFQPIFEVNCIIILLSEARIYEIEAAYFSIQLQSSYFHTFAEISCFLFLGLNNLHYLFISYFLVTVELFEELGLNFG